jgi:hypothetical protein
MSTTTRTTDIATQDDPRVELMAAAEALAARLGRRAEQLLDHDERTVILLLDRPVLMRWGHATAIDVIAVQAGEDEHGIFAEELASGPGGRLHARRARS